MSLPELFAKHLLDTKNIDITLSVTEKIPLSRFIELYWGFEYTCFAAGYSFSKEEIAKLRFMIDNGLGWEDMKTDGALGDGISK